MRVLALAAVAASLLCVPASGQTSGNAPVSSSGGAATASATIANQYTVLFAAGKLTNAHGCWVRNPWFNGSPLYVDWTGATGVTLLSTSQELLPGDQVPCDQLYRNAVTVFCAAAEPVEAGIN